MSKLQALGDELRSALSASGGTVSSIWMHQLARATDGPEELEQLLDIGRAWRREHGLEADGFVVGPVVE